jgi:glycosyltransferase involved in cell wall biosynthesis
VRICQLVASLDERYGGPSKSVYALCRGLADLGHEVDLFTLNTSRAEIRDEGRLRVRAHPREHPRFLARSSALWRELVKTPCDIVHNHALWLRPLHYARRLAGIRGAPLVNSPRGMMSPWAWNHHKLRKKFARVLVHPRAFSHTAAWHATSEEEAADIRARGFRQPICIAPNGVDAPSEDARREAAAYWRKVCPLVSSQPTAVFYSRFHPNNRLLELI